MNTVIIERVRQLFISGYTLLYLSPSFTPLPRWRPVWVMAFSLTCAIRGETESGEQPAGRRNVILAPPDDFVTFVHSLGLRGALPRTIRGSIDWGTQFSAEHLVQSMTFALTLTTSVSTAPQLLSNHSAVFIAWKRLGKGPFEVCETLDFSRAFCSLKNPFHF